MKILNKPTLVFTFFFLVLILNSWLITSQEVEDQDEFDYKKGSGKGPENWGDLHKEWKDCKKGKMQSPIDLGHRRVEASHELGKIKKSYRPANATLKNRGHDISIHFETGNAGSIQINGSHYVLDRCHWHSPSEHTINGKRFAAELHMVHRNLKHNKIAVIGVLYKIGKRDLFISELEKGISHISDSHKEVDIGVVNPRHLKIGGRKYYRYLGSLTTPPCTQGVIWTIHKKIRTISKEQTMLLRSAVHDSSEKNARPLQPVNGRNIIFYNGKHHHHKRHL